MERQPKTNRNTKNKWDDELIDGEKDRTTEVGRNRDGD